MFILFETIFSFSCIIDVLSIIYGILQFGFFDILIFLLIMLYEMNNLFLNQLIHFNSIQLAIHIISHCQVIENFVSLKWNQLRHKPINFQGFLSHLIAYYNIILIKSVILPIKKSLMIITSIYSIITSIINKFAW